MVYGDDGLPLLLMRVRFIRHAKARRNLPKLRPLPDPAGNMSRLGAEPPPRPQSGCRDLLFSGGTRRNRCVGEGGRIRRSRCPLWRGNNGSAAKYRPSRRQCRPRGLSSFRDPDISGLIARRLQRAIRGRQEEGIFVMSNRSKR
jgi:hypothetical protein